MAARPSCCAGHTANAAGRLLATDRAGRMLGSAIGLGSTGLFQPIYCSRRCAGDSRGLFCRVAARTGVNTSERKQCVVYGCSLKVEDDFCDEHGRGLRELFMCDACHNGSHYECVRRVGAFDELEGMLDADEGWRCRACVTASRFGVSTLLDSLVGDDGREQLLIRWYRPPRGIDNGQVEGRCHGDSHGRCTGDRCDAMADISIGTPQDIGHDFAGLKEDLVRRQAARTSRGSASIWPRIGFGRVAQGTHLHGPGGMPGIWTLSTGFGNS